MATTEQIWGSVQQVELICSKSPTPKTAFRSVSIQVQLVNYQCQSRARSHRL